jgi:hypothetical protein
MSESKQVAGARKAGIDDYAHGVARETASQSNDSPAKPPLPNFAIIDNGHVIENELQLTRAWVEYWAPKVYREVKRLEPKAVQNFMPDNWEGIYVIGAFVKIFLQENQQ